MGVERLYPCLELFGGVGEISAGDGFVFEQRRNKDHNIHTRAGMQELAKRLAMVEPNGLAVVEPTCSSLWVSDWCRISGF